MGGPGVHRWLVEALGDPVALSQLRPDDRLDPEPWRAAVERVRQARFGKLPAWDGAVAVGGFLARRFLASEPGHLTREALSLLPLERAITSVVIPMTERMRSQLELDFVPGGPGAGFLEVRGAFVVSAATLQGFFQAIIDVVPGQHLLRLAHQAEGFVSFELTASTA